MQDGATAPEFDAKGARVKLREGTNATICLPSDPGVTLVVPGSAGGLRVPDPSP